MFITTSIIVAVVLFLYSPQNYAEQKYSVHTYLANRDFQINLSLVIQILNVFLLGYFYMTLICFLL